MTMMMVSFASPLAVPEIETWLRDWQCKKRLVVNARKV
jgi:hypothetical protein